jgi:hypothetical protein
MVLWNIRFGTGNSNIRSIAIKVVILFRGFATFVYKK